jgi:hypothetical protein
MWFVDEHSSPPMIFSQTGSCPLHLASLGGNAKIVKMLLSHGAAVDLVNNVSSHQSRPQLIRSCSADPPPFTRPAMAGIQKWSECCWIMELIWIVRTRSAPVCLLSDVVRSLVTLRSRSHVKPGMRSWRAFYWNEAPISMLQNL